MIPPAAPGARSASSPPAARGSFWRRRSARPGWPGRACGRRRRDRRGRPSQSARRLPTLRTGGRRTPARRRRSRPSATPRRPPWRGTPRRRSSGRRGRPSMTPRGRGWDSPPNFMRMLRMRNHGRRPAACADAQCGAGAATIAALSPHFQLRAAMRPRHESLREQAFARPAAAKSRAIRRGCGAASAKLWCAAFKPPRNP